MSEKKLNKSKVELDKNEIYPAGIGVLGGWFCVHEDMSEDEALDWLWNKIKAGGTILEIPTEDKELFRDRLFGGWQCGDDPNRRHIYFAQAHYTFLGGTQTPLSDTDRKKMFQELYEKNPKERFIGSNKFMRACPMIN